MAILRSKSGRHQARGLPGYQPRQRFTPIIDDVLRAVEKATRKRRHTATQMYRRLRDEQG